MYRWRGGEFNIENHIHEYNETDINNYSLTTTYHIYIIYYITLHITYDIHIAYIHNTYTYTIQHTYNIHNT